MNFRDGALPCCVDFEASGLHPDSYPIEAGWSLSDGKVKSMLISHASAPYWNKRHLVSAGLVWSKQVMVRAELFEAAGIERALQIGDYWALLRSLGVSDERRRTRLLEMAKSSALGPYHRTATHVRLMIAVIKAAIGASVNSGHD